ncbi:acyl-CoA N-acyltransferase [Serratia phage vB_SmaS-Totoro]|nr:acyl-CoA N-acyltransferase [Serratia phage vB_SmaS-Totoro]
MYTIRLFDSSVNEAEMLEFMTTHKSSLDRKIDTLNKYHEKLAGIVSETETFYEHMSELSLTSGSYLLAAVLYDNNPIGFSSAIIERQELLIERLYVDEGHRLGNVAKTLYEALVSLTEPASVKAFCVAQNKKGCGFFESTGFVINHDESNNRCKVFEKKPQQEDFILNEIPREYSQHQEGYRSY